MIDFIFMILGFMLGWQLMNMIMPAPKISKLEPMTPQCPPHSWSWQKVHNEDGTVHHEHMVCAKCGPLRGEADGQ